MYFSQDFIDYFKDLAAHNNKEWFDAHKSRYEKSVKEPFEEFITMLIQQLSKRDKAYEGLEAKKCIFRIYRDVRFSKDKTPYKLNASAVINPKGVKSPEGGGIYIEAGPERFALYAGSYLPEKEPLYKIRKHIMNNLKEFDKLLHQKPFLDLWGGEVHGEKNKRLDNEFIEVAKKQGLLFNKQFYFMKEFPSQQLLKEDLLSIVKEHYTAIKPLNDFLLDAVEAK